MIRPKDVKKNAITCHQVLVRTLDGQFHEGDGIVWFTTDLSSLPRFNAVLRAAVTQPEELAVVKALTLAARMSARRADYADEILFATPSGNPLYQRLGIETIATADLYDQDGGYHGTT